MLSRVKKMLDKRGFFYLEKGGGGKKEVIYNMCDFFFKMCL